MNKAIEEWRDIEGYNGIYQVSNLGRVRRTRGREGAHIMSQWNKGNAKYKRVRLTARELNKREVASVHRLVARAFIDNPNGHNVVNHLDFNPENNNVQNLEWCTQAHNVRHSYKHGRCVNDYWLGKRGTTANLSDEQVGEIKNLRLSGLQINKIAGKIGTNKKSVWNIIHGKTYKHVPPAPQGDE